MEVDYVRVYECSKDKITGKGCASDQDPRITPLPGVAKPTPQQFNLFKHGFIF